MSARAPAANEHESVNRRAAADETDPPAIPRAAPAAAPLTKVEFAGEMAALGPYPEPLFLAVACSGGADSLALTLLAAEWAEAQGGRIMALTVDHGLRPGSDGEAIQVGRWLAGHGIDHAILRWSGNKPRADLAAKARAARYRLLAGWCVEAGIGDLLLGHHQGDQAETFLLRLARGSGVDGLSAMAPVTMLPVTKPGVSSRPPEAGQIRLLRPLLGVQRARLEALLLARGQPFIMDPSNESSRFARNRLRRLMPALAEEGLGAARLAGTARRLRRVRAALEQMAQAHLALSVRFDGSGFALLDVPVLTAPAVPDEIALRALAAALRIVGGQSLPLRLERLERLYGRLRDGGIGKGRTLAGCHLLPWRGTIALCREASALAPPAAVTTVAGQMIWDGRFALSWRGLERDPGVGSACASRLRVGPLGRSGLAMVRRRAASVGGARALEARLRTLPPPARPTLPALFGLDGVLAVPHLHYQCHGGSTGDAWGFAARFLGPEAAQGGVALMGGEC